MLFTKERQLPIPVGLIDQMKKTEQNPRYHAEGNVYNHTLLVLEQFEKYRQEQTLTPEEEEVLYWTCVLHDIGKPKVTHWVNGRWKATGHEKAGVPIARDILLQQSNISQAQRQRILSLIRWHHIPLQWGLRQKDHHAYQVLATQVDMRMLGLFSHFDMQGRICVQQDSVMDLIATFNQEIVPKIAFEIGTFEAIQTHFQKVSRDHKNALWRSIQLKRGELLEKLFQAAPRPASFSPFVVTMTLGSPDDAALASLQDQFANLPSYDLSEVSLQITNAHERSLQLRQAKHFLSVYGKGQKHLWMHAGWLAPEDRQFLAEHIRQLGGEIRYQIYEQSLAHLTASAAEEAEVSQLKDVYAAWELPHPWEGHQMTLFP
ncbi:MAG: HD domain-containing protein [Bacteroidota bacterium]